jgi:hypothetical protein
MVKDFTDFSTLDFINAAPNLVCGQALMDRQRHYGIVVKKGRTSFQIVCVSSGILKLTKLSVRQITEEWMEADYPFEKALEHLQDMCKRHGATEAAKTALDKLAKDGKEPLQGKLFA